MVRLPIATLLLFPAVFVCSAQEIPVGGTGDLVSQSVDTAPSPGISSDTVRPAAVPPLTPNDMNHDSVGKSTPETSPAPAEILEEEDFLIIEDGEESILGVEAPPKTVVKNEPGVGDDALPVVVDTMAAGETDVNTEPPVPLKPVVVGASGRSAVDSPMVVPSVIEDVQSINFARNLKEYRSPKLAMLMSLILPGAGQAYSKRYVKTAIFGAVELAIIGSAVAFTVRGKSLDTKAQRFADHHFDTTSFYAYTGALREYLQTVVYDYKGNADSLAKAEMLAIYDIGGNSFEEFKSGFSASVRRHGSAYYDDVAGKAFVHGWDDAVPDYKQIFTPGSETNFYEVFGKDTMFFQVYDNGENAEESYLILKSDRLDNLVKDDDRVYGYSPNQEKYKGIVSSANNKYKAANGVLIAILLNHIGSAIDAGISAKRHNDALLGKQSLWNRIDLDQQWVSTGRGVAAGYAIRVAF